MFLDPTDKYTKYFYNDYHIVDEFLTKLYPDEIMDIVVYEGNLVDNFIGYGPFDVVIFEKPTSSWSSGQEVYFTNDENWVDHIREEFEKDYEDE